MKNLKQIAGEKAAEFVRSGMTLGLGSGSTVYWAFRQIGAMVKQGLNVRGVPTSEKTEELANEFGIPLMEIGAAGKLDLTIDGADEIDRDLNLIKGGGGALFREKLVAAASRKLIIVADESKLVDTLGAFPLPVEIVQFGWETTRDRIARAGLKTVLRMDGEKAFVTDNGNFILDCHCERIGDAAGLHSELKSILGVVETGLFMGMADMAVVAGEGGIEMIGGIPG